MSSGSASQEFASLATEYLHSYFDFYPHCASAMGLHEYDGVAPDLRQQAIDQRVRQVRAYLQRLQQLPRDLLAGDERLDYDLLGLVMQGEAFSWEQLRFHRTNPMFYIGPLDVSNYVKRNYAPLDQRVRALVRYERQVPRIIESAKENLTDPIPSPYLEVAVQQLQGQRFYLLRELPRAVKQVTVPELVSEFTSANQEAVAAVEDLLRFLDEKRATVTAEFALGTERYSRLLRYGEAVDLPLDGLLQLGYADLHRNQESLQSIAGHLARGGGVRELMDMVARRHPSAESLIADAAAVLDELRQFITDRRLVTVPSDIRPVVEPSPPYLRWAFAMMSSPGPYEQVAAEAYYYVTPVEPEWSEQQKQEWLRRFNYPTLKVIGVHEVYPGHYLDFLHFRQVGSDIRKTFRAYSRTEGWAHYCEEMVLEEGYAIGDQLVKAAQLQEALLRDCRYIVSIEMHAGNMSLEEATKFFMDNAYMDQHPAYKEAVRGTFDPQYLNYTLGKLLILKLREDYRRRAGGRFSLREFHDRFLALGAPPVPLARQALLGDLGASS